MVGKLSDHESFRPMLDQSLYPPRTSRSTDTCAQDHGAGNSLSVRYGLEHPVHARYACLSHCWGDQKFIQTTSLNLEGHRKCIPWADIPRTFQDALDLTWRLGLTYLWIDSLCILQNDMTDWRHEAGKMASVYSQSYITFAATDSSNPNGGLFSEPCSTELAKHILVRNGDHPAYDLYLNRVPGRVLRNADKRTLLQRAWVFREHFMSPRVVHFGGSELWWESRTVSVCECGTQTRNLSLQGLHWDHDLEM